MQRNELIKRTFISAPYTWEYTYVYETFNSGEICQLIFLLPQKEHGFEK